MSKKIKKTTSKSQKDTSMPRNPESGQDTTQSAENEAIDFLESLEEELLLETDLSQLTAEQQFELIVDKMGSHPEAITPRMELLERLKASKESSEPLVVKFGIDPTGPDIHIGHAVSLIMLRRFQRMGHRIQLVIGDFTARIGDPTDRTTERDAITDDEIRHNMESYFDQAARIIDLRQEQNKQVEMVFNSEWLGKISLTEWVPLLQRISAVQMMQRQDFQKRIQMGGTVSMAELMYSLFMAYDSVVLKPDVELGGMDQFVNLHWCRDLMTMHDANPEVFVVVDLLPGTTGTRDDEGRLKKMSKSSRNYIRMTEEPAEMYGKTMSIPDEVMWVWFRELTDISSQQLLKLREYVEQGILHPMDVKKMLARLVVGTFNYKDKGQIAEAESTFMEKFGKEKAILPSDIKTVEVEMSSRLIDVLSQISGESKTTLRKMQGGISVLKGEDYVTVSIDELNELTIDSETVVKLGKRRYYRFVSTK